MEFKCWIYFIWIISSCIQCGFSCFSDRPAPCGCNTYKFMKQRGKQLYCDKTTDYRDIFSLSSNLPRDVISIDFSGHGITGLSRSLFSVKVVGTFKNVLELILGNNKISQIETGTFQDFQNLISLNLSNNSIGRLHKDMFIGLTKLQRLYLNYNTFPVISGDAFQYLPSLKRLELNSGYLICNCLMKDFAMWYRSNATTGMKLAGTCTLPRTRHGDLLRRIKPATLEKCDVLGDLPYFEIRPSKRQVVFEGDLLPLDCEGTDLENSQVSWSLNEMKVDSDSELYDENIKLYPNQTLISSRIQLTLTPKWSGFWKCTIQSNYSHVSEQVNVVVLQNDTVYCDRVNVTNDFGQFQWSEAVTGAKLTINCPEPSLSPLSGIAYTASRSCLRHGIWSDGDYSNCQYIDEVARLVDNTLQQNVSATDAVDRCEHVTSTLSNVKIREPVGVKMISKLMLECHESITTSDAFKVGRVLIELASQTMTSSSDVMMTSQKSDHVCHVINDVIRSTAHEMLLNSTTSFHEGSENLAVAGYNVQTTDALHCNITESKKDMSVNCGMNVPNKYEGLTQPCISFPFPVMKHMAMYKLYITVHRNGNLFQSSNQKIMNIYEYSKWESKQSNDLQTTSDSVNVDAVSESDSSIVFPDEPTKYVIVSNVYSITSNPYLNQNFSKPIVMLFHTAEQVSILNWNSHHYVALWDGIKWRKNNGECKFKQMTFHQLNSNITIVQCNVLGTFAIMKNLDESHNSEKSSYKLQTMHPTIYVGTSILSLSLTLIIFTYITFKNLVISRDARHMVINVALHLLLDVVAFTIGIWRVDHKVLCYCTGITLHYSSLSILIWIVLSARNISKELLASQQPPLLDPKPQRPMLRFYLLGCGIPVIICGITAAAKIQNYNGDEEKYCWLSWETSLYAFYAPAALIAIGCILVLLRILATLNCAPSGELNSQNRKRKKRQDDAVIGETTPLQHMESSFNGNHDQISTVTPIPKEIDNEQAYRTRLRGVALILVFFIATWVAAAMSVAAPQIQAPNSLHVIFQQSSHDQISSSNDTQTTVDLNVVFSCLFATFASATSVFLFMQHVATRRDATTRWRFLCHRRKQKSPDNNGCTEIDLITNIKSTNDLKRENTVTTNETVLPNTTGGEDTSPANCGSLRSLPITPPIKPTNDSSFIINSMCSDASSYKGKSRSTRQSSSSFMQLSDGNKMQMASRDSNSYGKHHYHHGSHHLYKHHHHSRDGSRPMKMTNLQHQHDSSMTEHSFDENQMNMHTIPVVMQNNGQLKMDNSVVYHKYQRFRKNLEAKRNHQRKLTVLREYAQDPLTSNDEAKDDRNKLGKNRESAPLLGTAEHNKDESINENLAINEYKKADQNEKLSNGDVNVHTYRPLLISSPNRKKEEPKHRNHTRRRSSGNPNLASNYNRRKLSHHTERVAEASKRHKSSRKVTNREKYQDSVNETDSVAPSSVVSTWRDVADLSLHGIEAKNDLENQATVLQGQKNHSYLTASDVLSGQFHIPSRKSSKSEASADKSQSLPAEPETAGSSKQASNPAINSDVELNDNDDATAYSSLRNETTV